MNQHTRSTLERTGTKIGTRKFTTKEERKSNVSIYISYTYLSLSLSLERVCSGAVFQCSSVLHRESLTGAQRPNNNPS